MVRGARKGRDARWIDSEEMRGEADVISYGLEERRTLLCMYVFTGGRKRRAGGGVLCQ
jgi:hypothetical protein